MTSLLDGKFLATGRAIDKAAQHLPSGYNVNISIERHGWGFNLELPNGETVDIDNSDIDSSIDDAIEWACNHDAMQNQPELPNVGLV